MIVDGHVSHVTTKAIKFCLASKTILLCLPPHTTHILQPLDVGIFAALAALYKKGVRERSRFLVDYSIDKVDFLEIYRSAREGAFTESNISKAWKAVGLEPFDPDVVLKQLPGQTLATIRPSTPLVIVSLSARGDTVQVPITLANVAQVEELFEQIKKGERLDPATLMRIKKLMKGATKSIANTKIQQATNAELVAAKETKRRRGKRSKENYGFARVMDAELIKERELDWRFEKYEDALKGLLRMGPSIFGFRAKRKKGSSPSKSKASSQQVPTAQLQLIEQLSPAVLRFLQPESISPVKSISLVKETGKKVLLGKATGKEKSIQKAPVPRKALVCKKVVEKAREQARVVQTRSGRKVVRTVAFEAGKN